MRTYVVQPGDSPASIAARSEMAGCPKCARDLVLYANPHKPTVTLPNGFVTFRDLRVGETLNIPDKWSNGDLDMRPPAYFAALPYADGVTPSSLGVAAAGVLGDYAQLDAATARVTALASMDDRSFSAAVGDVGLLIDSAVKEAYGSGNAAASQSAQAVQNDTQLAWQHNGDLSSAIAAGDQATVAQARLAVKNWLTAALGNARLALQAFYGGQQTAPPTSGSFPATVVAAAQTAAAAVAADPSYCSSVARPGTAVNSAVHNFKAAWNSSQSPPVPINTGNYEQPTADALARVVGAAPTACGAQVAPPPPPPVHPCPVYPPGYAGPAIPGCPLPAQQAAAAKSGGLSTGEVVGIGLASAAALGTVVMLATRAPRRRRGRARP